MRPLAASAMLIAALAGCERADKAADKKTEPPAIKPDRPDLYTPRVPKHGALVEMCGLTGTGPECVLAILDADAHTLRFHPWAPLGQPPEQTIEIPAARAAELYALAKRVLGSRAAKAEDVTDFMMNLAISDAPDTFHVQTSGPFTDPTAKALVDGLLELVPRPSK